MTTSQPRETDKITAERDTLRAEVERLRAACSRENDTISQVLGRALGYPRFADDQKNFPGATDDDGVCVGDHVAASLADEAANVIRTLRSEVERLRAPSVTCPACGSDANERDELTKAEREIERLRADAERYRWLLINATNIDIGPGYAVLYTMRGGWHTASLTAAIDAGRAAQEGKT